MNEYAELSSDGGRFWDGDDWGWRPLWMTATRVMEHARACFGVDVRTVNLLGGGLLNQTWLLHCSDRDRVLRVGRPERSLEQVRLRADSQPCLGRADCLPLIAAEMDAVPVASEQDQVHVLSLFPFRAGVPGTVVPATTRLMQLAPAMATMHCTARDWVRTSAQG